MAVMAVTPPAESDALSLQCALSALAGFVCTLIWVLTGFGTFWAGWVWLGLGIAVGVHVVIRRGMDPAPERHRALRIQAEASALIVAGAFVAWALSGGGAFWPVWSGLALGTALAAHVIILRQRPDAREAQLEERVDELTRTRRGALDVQAAELRRIERDLHDGAQARLVALSMRLGRAEEKLSGQPEVAELVRQARDDASSAIAELRDLARGIAPPVLADRGLAAALEGLGRRAAIPVAVEAHIEERPPPMVETAAYFVAAEALTNAAKHGKGSPALVRAELDDDVLMVEVSDKGPGGADAEGSGLLGLRQRAQALDGRLTVVSSPGDGTTVRAELPCGS